MSKESLRELPTGTVTFLFTDVEGSTRLLERLGERYREVQERHDAIVRAAIAAADGCEVSTEGDSFFAVFASPAGAARCAVAAQRELAAAAWPDGLQVRVRMGLHTGEGLLAGDSYLGLDVNRAARVAAAAHGGQVLLSSATRGLVERRLPPATRLRDLGEHRLKDLTEGVHMSQLVIDGLEQDFPPPRTFGGRPNNLPAQLTRFIGRGDEVARVRELLDANRLVTLTGTGGTGKTRLALQVAEASLADFPDGVFFVDLSAVDEPELVPASMAAALHVREEAGRDAGDGLKEHLRDKQILLVIDNFEQLVDGAPALEAQLRASQGVKALVTSRVPLRLYGEQRFQVPPLARPDPRRLPDFESLRQLDAVVLFAERAASVCPDFRVTADNAATVAQITARLDGLPLAIELAASRSALLPPDRLLDRLQQRLPLLATSDRNVPERQRTLRRTIEWSYDLLSPPERRLFARFAVFAGGADLEAVDAVLNPAAELGVDTTDALAALVDTSLVRSVVARGDARFAMLETVREYALEQLVAGGDEASIRHRHAEHFLRVAESAAPNLLGADQASWTQRLELDHDNFRSALTWLQQACEAELGLRLAAALANFWRHGSHVREGLRRLGELLALPEAAPRTSARARALSAAAGLHAWIDDPAGFLGLAEEALAIYRERGDVAEIPEALANLGWAQLQTGQLEVAQRNLAQAKELIATTGNARVAADCANGLALAALLQGRPADARPFFEEALETYNEQRDTYWVGLTTLMLAQVDRKEGHLEAADERVGIALAAFRDLDSEMGTAWALYSFADVAVQRGLGERALRLVGACDALLSGVGEMPALATATMGDVAAAARATVDAAVAETAYAEGRAMDADHAVAYALQSSRA